MFARQPPLKIHPDHLDRLAVIYVRQSTLFQVRENSGSTARQYDLASRAEALGWPPSRIQVVDQDQGHSGASSLGRAGFEWLAAQVGLGHVGAVLSLEVSRLARNNSDWYRLLELCALAETLVIDEEGIYDPGAPNDRLLLGIKGTMSEAELGWLRSRLQGGKLAKAEQGCLRFRLPIGLVYDPVGQIVFDPDEAVQEAVRLVFSLFEQTSSALAVVSYFARHHLRFPARWWGGKQAEELHWGHLTHTRVLTLLHCPLYAGAYVYGRTQFRRKTLPGETPRITGRTRRVSQEDWPIVRLEAHPGYISWDAFQHNQRQLDDNRTWRAEEHRGAIREGPSLLQGIVLCGTCGRRMSIRYQRAGTLLMYECHQLHSQLAGKTCQTLRGDRVDQAVVQCFLEAIQPAQIEVALSALDQIEAHARQVDQQWRRQLERAEYEADLARRRYKTVEPENRLVARSLEREWNEKLAALERLEHEYALAPKHAALSLSPAQREQIRRLAQDLPAIFQAPTTTFAQRKQLVRWLIKDVTLSKRGNLIDLVIRWQTEALTHLAIPRHKKSWEVSQTSQQVVSRVRELAPTHPDTQIAARLNAEGAVAGKGGTFTASKVEWIRYAYAIPLCCPERPSAARTGQRGDGRYSAQAAADVLNVDVSTIAEWCKLGKLEAVRATPHGPRWITLTPDLIATLRKPVRRRWKQRPLER